MNKPAATTQLGFIGLGVMGEPICRHLATKSQALAASASMIAFDVDPQAISRLVRCGQVAKILNNMVLFETVAALAEALVIGEAAGIDRTVLFETLSKGSADSFALRNHGIKAMLPGDFPLRAFSVRYAQKDLGYALRLAEQAGIEVTGASHVNALFERAVQAGLGERYHPVISELFKASR